MKKKLKILLLFDSPYHVPRDYSFSKEFRTADWKTERDTYRVLCDYGHEVKPLGLYNNINILIEELTENKPDVVYNLTEVFRQKSRFEKNIPWLLELFDIPYTGSSPTSLLICNDKALSKKILLYHKIKVPHFHTFYRNRRVWLPKRLRLPLVIKPLCEEASRGISQASIVDGEESFIERIRFIHQNMKMDAIAEEYIEGRELYVSVIGNKRVSVLPPREMCFGQMSDDEPRIATYKAKWDEAYRKKWKIKNSFTKNLEDELFRQIADTCKRAYRALNMRCYARFDVRVTKGGRVFILEPNANPSLQKDDELSRSAERYGLSYEKLVQKILGLAFKRYML